MVLEVGMVTIIPIQKVVWRCCTNKMSINFSTKIRTLSSLKEHSRIGRLETSKYRKIFQRPGSSLNHTRGAYISIPHTYAHLMALFHLGHMQVCTSLQTDNHASTEPLSFLQAGCPSCHPINIVKALKASSLPYPINPFLVDREPRTPHQ